MTRKERAGRAVDLAGTLLREARAQETPEEKAQARRLARMMEDPRGKQLTIALVDQAFRSRRPERIADQLGYLLERYGTPQFMEWWERVALMLGGVMGHYLPSVVVPPIVARLRHETESLILPAEEDELRQYLTERRRAGVRLNLNLLGEAILGEGEAARRLEAYLALLAREDVEYISVKVSSVFSQINLVAFRHTVERVKERLRVLYGQALRHQYRHADGHLTPKFINLDMEEHRDLDLTVTAFREVLDEAEFLPLRAGVVLQAYLPESHRVQRALTAWAIERRRRGGAPIKLRIVKGANLAMEGIEAARHGWPQAPYTTKVDVDANFKRMVEYGCHLDHAPAVHLGIATHNLFDVAHGLVLRDDPESLSPIGGEGRVRGPGSLEPFVEFEMLEGMANHQARAVQARAGGLLLYAPVVRAEDFHSAIAYLVRRLDENTAPNNFLRHVFGLEPGSPDWERERDRFLSAFDLVDEVSDAPRQHQNRAGETLESFSNESLSPIGGEGRVRGRTSRMDSTFSNEPDTDWSVSANREWIDAVITSWSDRPPETVPLQIGGELIAGAGETEAQDRSRPERAAYRHALAGREQIGRALDVAHAAQKTWAAGPASERRALLEQAAAVLACRRGDLIGAMIVDGAKTVAEADPEVSEAIDFARYYLRSLEEAGPDLTGCQMDPLGVIVIAPPWNFPLSIPASGVLAALAAGNSVLLKPAPEAVLVGWHLAKALWDGGIPRDVLQFMPCPDDDVGRSLVTDPRVDAVILTGSAETARRFLTWRPDLTLFAETSGKNAMIITALSDRDQAIRDLIHSAFGHQGQKCSAASLAICEAEVYDDAVFRRQLRDAAISLGAGSAWETSSRITPLTQAPGEALRRALTTLDEGEEWLLEPRLMTGEHPHLWSPGIKLGVRGGSFFHRTECFGPVLGLMRAENLDEAIELANGTPYGLTSGIQSLDDREIDRWIDRIEAGNLYVNRPITGAMVGRQPFGGWKASSVGPGAKVGGPNYVLQLARWRASTSLSPIGGKGRSENESLSPIGGERRSSSRDAALSDEARAEWVREQGSRADNESLSPIGGEGGVRGQLSALLERWLAEEQDEQAKALLRASAASYALAWQRHFSREHDPMRILGERNVFRYRPCRHVLVRAEAASPAGRLALQQVLLAALTCDVPLTVSLSRGEQSPWLGEHAAVAAGIESEADLIEHLRSAEDVERLRVLAPVSLGVRAAAHEAGVAVIDAPVLATGRLELRWYLREQTIARVVHRYGNIMEPAATE
jgi:RHH-type transcriptional regulator, proline utilization regulon repressor / proline dehydrogenase / delta 1-pyrroline-5-carboxylate dehydrogenase